MNKKRSKKVLGRVPESTYLVKEVIMIEEYSNCPKRPFERTYSVDDFTFRPIFTKT